MSKWWIGGQPYTCENARFKTNINKGHSHGLAPARGSALLNPLVSHHYSLWLEHIVDKQDDSEAFWLMWYDDQGRPTIPLSGAMWLDQLRDMVGGLSKFIEPK